MTDIYFSDVFEVDRTRLESHGAFDVSLVNDLPLFVDPFLLFNSEREEYQELHDGMIRYMQFLKHVSLNEAIGPGLIQAWFTFPEVRQNWLGYSYTGNRGHGLGSDFARILHKNFNSVFREFGDETVTKSSHIEKLCLIRDGVGRDNISDFTMNLIKGFLAEYTERFATEHVDPKRRRKIQLPRAGFNFETRSWTTREYDLPFSRGDYVLLTPKDILTKDETWINRAELIDRLSTIANALPNEALRAQLNEYLLRSVPRGPKVKPKEIRDAIAHAIDLFPGVIDYYIREKEDEGDRAVSVSQQRVAHVERQFVRAVRAFVDEFLDGRRFYEVSGSTYEEAHERVAFLKDVIENKGGHRMFYIDGQPLERESDLRILYRLTWFATPSDVSTEVNDGRGPADVKISRGARDKTIVEFKLAKNTQLERNLQKQTAIYEKASDASHPSIKVILYFSERQRRRVDAILRSLKLQGSPDVILIDARSDNKPTGSKA